MSVRRRLLRDAFLVLAVYLAIHAVAMCAEYGIGWDAHAYYVAWSGGLYEAAARVGRRLQLQPAVRPGRSGR